MFSPLLHPQKQAQPSQKLRQTAYLFFYILFITFIAVEILVRLRGYSPWQTSQSVREPTIHEPDPVLGWQNKPGEYVIPAYTVDASDIKMTFWPGGRRATQAQKQNRIHQILAVGCSFTQGWAISDSETFAWKLQQQFPPIEFLNYGTTGYGTYQSLLLLENDFKRSNTAPLLVLYGFNGFHESRNVAEQYWLKALSRASHRGHVYLPYCLMGPDGALERHPPERYPMWPLKGTFATIPFLEDCYMRFKTRGRATQRRVVTEKLLLEMNQLCREKGSKLVIVLLTAGAQDKLHYIKFFQKEGICFVDCVHPNYDSPEMKVAGEGHPKGAMNTFWADCIEEALRIEISRVDLHGK